MVLHSSLKWMNRLNNDSKQIQNIYSAGSVAKIAETPYIIEASKSRPSNGPVLFAKVPRKSQGDPRCAQEGVKIESNIVKWDLMSETSLGNSS